MKKRSAMFVAAGLVLAMIVAGLGFAMGLTGPSADAKKALTVKRQKPIVHTVTKTVTIHKQAKAGGDDTSTSGTVIFQQATTPTGTTTTTSSDDSGSEHESEQGSDDGSASGSHESSDSSEGSDD